MMIQRLNILNILNFRMTKAGLVWMDVSIDVGSSKPEGVTLSTYLYIYILMNYSDLTLDIAGIMVRIR
jgi:hypothetical protein